MLKDCTLDSASPTFQAALRSPASCTFCGGVGVVAGDVSDFHHKTATVTTVQSQARSHCSAAWLVTTFRLNLALQSEINILTRNARDYVVIETEEFGDVLFVAIGRN
ncbi:hypothetical protein BKA67DRAFT_580440 [Truncatella angustata]|uniref:Uncharacterized protein n=1 Tax=Truncatella angustata TaxID=152316 RepID=A0A9P8UCI8_9PEZI|nr:uncharacterized protein BKA67DRAFT_580440 [Truncatella angustata]KAH6646746.1 hypothetical protein BKA67DRAFT_580440 [Truncatella angustata]